MSVVAALRLGSLYRSQLYGRESGWDRLADYTYSPILQMQ